jgi:predicted kinase
MPYLLITNGPTGSGKSSLVQKTINHYGLEKEPKKFLIDDLIEKNPNYKNAIDNLIKKECSDDKKDCSENCEVCQKLRLELIDPSPETYLKFGKLYAKYRGSKPDQERWCQCDKTGLCSKTCDEYLMILLRESIDKGENIVFETTGSYYVNWLIDMVEMYEYEVYYTYTILEFCENVKRNKTRALEQMTSYIIDTKNFPAPRLPDVQVKVHSEAVNQILKVMFETMENQVSGKINVSIIVFDNTSLDTGVLYDSRSSEELPLDKVRTRIKNVVWKHSCSRTAYCSDKSIYR